MKIGFLGLGHMGRPMALNLLTAGHALWVYDLQSEAMQVLSEAGATALHSPAQLASSGCEVVITMLPGPQQVRHLYLGVDPDAEMPGLLAQCPPSVLWIDCSTIDPQTALALAQTAVQHGHRFADAPVSGGTGGAQAGTLTLMVGTDDQTWAELQTNQVLQSVGKNIVRCGHHGLGQAAKLCNNLLLGISMVGVAEAMRLGMALGMEAKVLASIINTSTGRCWSSDTYNPVPGVVPTAPASRGYSGGFGIGLMHKDMRLALQAAVHKGLTLPAGQIALAQYQRGLEKPDLQSLDFSAVIGVYDDT